MKFLIRRQIPGILIEIFFINLMIYLLLSWYCNYGKNQECNFNSKRVELYEN